MIFGTINKFFQYITLKANGIHACAGSILFIAFLILQNIAFSLHKPFSINTPENKISNSLIPVCVCVNTAEHHLNIRLLCFTKSNVNHNY